VALNDRRNLTYAVVAGILVASLGLSACGRRGALEPPPHAQSTDPAYAVGAPPAEAKKNAKPDRPFFLDRLL
jgi:predicted small lipoprotein YifL